MKHPLNPRGGKGDRYRDVDKKKYDETWIRCFGLECKKCNGTGLVSAYGVSNSGNVSQECPICDGLGKVDRK